MEECASTHKVLQPSFWTSFEHYQAFGIIAVQQRSVRKTTTPRGQQSLCTLFQYLGYLWRDFLCQNSFIYLFIFVNNKYLFASINIYIMHMQSFMSMIGLLCLSMFTTYSKPEERIELIRANISYCSIQFMYCILMQTK